MVNDHLKSISSHYHWNGRLTATSPNKLGDHIVVRVLDPCNGCIHMLLADVKSLALQGCELFEHWQEFEAPKGEEKQFQGYRQSLLTDLNEAPTISLTWKLISSLRTSRILKDTPLTGQDYYWTSGHTYLLMHRVWH